MDILHQKYERLLSDLEHAGRLAVAFSGGVDSAFLLKAAKTALGDGVLALTGRFVSFPAREEAAARALCGELGVRWITVDVDQTAVPAFRQNLPDRCYHCKKALFSAFAAAAAAKGFFALADGTNADDAAGYRPGMQALRELGIQSPLRDAGLAKAEIRALSRELGLPTWNQPSMACLATRFPYYEEITAEKLLAVDRAEEMLRGLGAAQVRVRAHGSIARIEADPMCFGLLTSPGNRAAIVEYLRSLGFLYAALELGGYESGSMDRALRLTGEKTEST